MKFTLLLSCIIASVAFSQVPDDTAKMLSFIAAQQLNTTAIYDSLSYTAVVKSATKEDFAPELFRQTVVLRFCKRGTSFLLTRESSHVIFEHENRVNGKLVEPTVEVKEEPLAKRMLMTDAAALLWMDVTLPRLDYQVKEDWKDTKGGYKQNWLIYGSAGDIKGLCFGESNPFHELLPLSPEFTTWALYSESPERYRLERTITVNPENKVQDLTLTVDARTGLLIQGIDKRSGGSVGSCTIEYMDIPYKTGTVRVPRLYRSKDVDGSGAVIEEIEVVFSDYTDESALPPYSLGDIGMPDGAKVWRISPSAKVVKMQWTGGVLKEY